MKHCILKTSMLVSCLMASMAWSVCPAIAQNTPADSSQKPASAQQKPAEANPFPDDTTKVPVMPAKRTPSLPEGTYTGDDTSASTPHLPVPKDDSDPVRSPDDAAAPTDKAPMELSGSDSRAGLDRIIPGPDDDDQPQGKHRKLAVPGPEHQETAQEDLQVGGYYLETKNWKAAVSRFESALVLDPDEPDVYWGLAESERHLGNLAAARGYYQKVAEFDPGSKHGKEAMKALKDPQIANAITVPPPTPAK
jgi:hypothetical protein